MKRILQLFTILLGAWAISACCSPEEEIERVTPQIMGQSITSGATNVAAAPAVIIILFDRDVRLNNESEIFFSPKVATEVAVSDNKLTITTLEAMQYDCDYTLTIGYGAVKDSKTGGENHERIITFRTEEGPYVAPSEPATILAMPNAMPSTQRIYDYLWAMYGRYTLSSASMSSDMRLNECEWVKKWTGSYPAILNLDYQHLYVSPSPNLDYGNIELAELWWLEGGLLSASWTWMVPPREGSKVGYTCESAATQFRVANVFVEDSWENKVVEADLEEMANILLQYKELGITIIWRPLHESVNDGSAAGKYWWLAAGGNTYKKLWCKMFDYFCERGLDNLIWVWNTCQGSTEYYPGEEYVDIVACDIFMTLSPDAVASTWRRLNETYPHRMISLCEMGRVASMSRQLDHGATWSYYMPWYDMNNDLSEGYDHRYASIAWWNEAFGDTRVITREELPPFH